MRLRVLTFLCGDRGCSAVALDQWIKRLVETRLPMQETVDMLPFLALYRTYNTGVAFSMFASIGDIGLIAISAAVIAVRALSRRRARRPARSSRASALR